MTMRTLALTVAYDGTDWSGFQRQKTFPTVQGELETALSAVLQHPVELGAAGRTDAGVHALAQVVSLETPNPMPVDRIPWVTNRFLPASIRVRRAEEREPGFHARWSARYRRYWYRIQVTRQVDPFVGRFCWQIAEPLDVAAMQDALTAIRGRRDFMAVCHDRSQAKTTTRTLQRALVHRWGDYVIVDIQADAFLHQMVRLIVANAVAIGKGECSPAWLGQLLETRERHQAGKGAPPHGLMLMRIGYPPAEGLFRGESLGEVCDEELPG